MVRRIKISLDENDADDAAVLTFIDSLAQLSNARRGEAMRRLLHQAVRCSFSASEVETRPAAPRAVRARAVPAVKPVEPRAPKVEPVLTRAAEPLAVKPEPVLATGDPAPLIASLDAEEPEPRTNRKPSLAMW
jgi:hypothetical protein